ncbi:MAG: pilus assembly protein N-terminal domain-containing protein [Thermogutta sp.]
MMRSFSQLFRHVELRSGFCAFLWCVVLALETGFAQQVAPLPPSGGGSGGAPSGVALGSNAVVCKITESNQRQELTVNTSRILTLDQRIPQAQVNNPEILQLTALSPNQIQIFAKKPGVTQVNLWDEAGTIYSIDVIVFGDARELSLLIESQFPNCSIRVVPISNGVMLSGYVDQPEHVSRIMQLAQEYYPRVINNLTLGGVHEVLLHVKVMEVSRTKLRALGFDWTQISGQNIVRSSVSGLISGATGADAVAGTSASAVTSGAETFFFSVIDGSDAFFGVLEALRQDNLMKVLAEPTLVTVSGRPAFFQVGGEFPIIVPQSLGTVSIEYKKYGTQVDFVPIVLGNGKIRLEVRPRVSEIDTARSVVINSTTVPGLRVREVDTGVEMKAGQTLAIAGLVETRVEAQRRGLPWISDVPYIGVPFRRVVEKTNDVELLILVTPELVSAMNPEEVPPGGPGMSTSSPTDSELYFGGLIEVQRCCPAGTAGDAGMIEVLPPSQDAAPTPAPVLQTVPPSGPVLNRVPSKLPVATRPAAGTKPAPSAAPLPPGETEAGGVKPLPGFKGKIGYGE